MIQIQIKNINSKSIEKQTFSINKYIIPNKL
jgi:hypothetical protein